MAEFSGLIESREMNWKMRLKTSNAAVIHQTLTAISCVLSKVQARNTGKYGACVTRCIDEVAIGLGH